MTFIYILIFGALFIFCTTFRVIVLHPVSTIVYGISDFINWIKYCGWRTFKSGFIICFVGLFGKGKTLSAVRYVCRVYRKKNDKRVYDFARKKWVTQKVMILSNVELSIPYIQLTSLRQIIDVSNRMRKIDEENDTLTVTLVLGDEFSVQMNSRQFKSNIDALFLNTLLTCRHHHISLIYTAQRFGHVDALLRQVTSYVVDCDKAWRIMRHAKYDAWDLENATSPTMCKPIRKYGWFIRDKDFNAYDTLACVSNLEKSYENGDMLTEEEILTLQGNNGSDMEVVARPSKRYIKLSRKKSK